MKRRCTVVVLLLAFIVLAAGVIAAGCLLYRSQQDSCRTEAEHNLAAVADLKVRNIVHWREERISDAQMVMLDEFLGQRVREFLGDVAHATVRPPLLARLQSIREHNQGRRAVLLDPQMNVRLASPQDKVYFGPIAQAFAVKALRSNRVVMSDLHRSQFTGEIHLDLAIPLGDRPASPRAGAPPLGVIVVEVDPKKLIYPRIQDWPVPSQTAETLLVCREGNEVVFLNELKFQKNTALALRVSLDSTELPAVRAALGQEGTVEGIDYRGVPVLAAVRAVPESPWFLVAKMDTSEVYAPMRERLWMVVLFVGALLFGLAAGVGVLWRQQHLTRQRQAEERARLEEARATTLLELSQMTDRSAAEIANCAMESAVKLTGSTIGYIAFANEDETVLTMHYWSNSAMQQCAMIDKPIVYPVKDTGLWGEAIRQRKPVITNDYAAPRASAY